jgi:uncharacterized membrane protein YqjE
MAIRDSARPLASTATEIVSEIAHLLQTEVRLARAEIGEKLASAANGGVLVGVATVLSLAGSLHCSWRRSNGSKSRDCRRNGDSY